MEEKYGEGGKGNHEEWFEKYSKGAKTKKKRVGEEKGNA